MASGIPARSCFPRDGFRARAALGIILICREFFERNRYKRIYAYHLGPECSRSFLRLRPYTRVYAFERAGASAFEEESASQSHAAATGLRFPMADCAAVSS